MGVRDRCQHEAIESPMPLSDLIVATRFSGAEFAATIQSIPRATARDECRDYAAKVCSETARDGSAMNAPSDFPANRNGRRCFRYHAVDGVLSSQRSRPETRVCFDHAPWLRQSSVCVANRLRSWSNDRYFRDSKPMVLLANAAGRTTAAGQSCTANDELCLYFYGCFRRRQGPLQSRPVARRHPRSLPKPMRVLTIRVVRRLCGTSPARV